MTKTRGRPPGENQTGDWRPGFTHAGGGTLFKGVIRHRQKLVWQCLHIHPFGPHSTIYPHVDTAYKCAAIELSCVQLLGEDNL